GGDLRAARAQVAAHRYEEDREGVVEHAVADGLGDGEGGDDAPPVTEAATAPGPGGGGIHGKVHVVSGRDSAAAASAGGGRGQRERCGQQAAADAGRQADPLLLCLGQVGGAHAGLRQVELDVAGRLPVPGQGGGDRAGLLVAGGQQEGGGAAVALDADGVVAGLGVGQFVRPVWRDGAAGVLVRVDERGQGAGGAEDRVQVQAEFGGDGVVGAEAGRPHDAVDDDVLLTA